MFAFQVRCTTLVILLQQVVGATWPVTIVDNSGAGSLCDDSKEQYLKVQVHDFHDYPEFSVTLRQLTGECGVYESDLQTWTGTFDDSAMVEGTSNGRVQLNLLVCAPFGEYELEIYTKSFSDFTTTSRRRTSWEILSGYDEIRVWDTLWTHLASDERYSPRTPGVYTWPLEGEVGFFGTLYVGRSETAPCESDTPPGVTYEGCFSPTLPRTSFNHDVHQLPVKGESGMTVEVCSDFCHGYEYFAMEDGYKCSCGSADEFGTVSESHECGTSQGFLCTGNSRTICGGPEGLVIYHHEVKSPSVRWSTPSRTLQLESRTPDPALSGFDNFFFELDSSVAPTSTEPTPYPTPYPTTPYPTTPYPTTPYPTTPYPTTPYPTTPYPTAPHPTNLPPNCYIVVGVDEESIYIPASEGWVDAMYPDYEKCYFVYNYSFTICCN